jgi:hypothetical protein
VAVLASVFTGSGGYGSPQAFISGLRPAMWVAVAVLAVGALVVLAFPFGAKQAEETGAEQAGVKGAAGEAQHVGDGSIPALARGAV